jgi:hypothetical protein
MSGQSAGFMPRWRCPALGRRRTSSDAQDNHWVNLVGEGQKAGKVVLPPLARAALDRCLIERQLPVSPERWQPTVALVPSLNAHSTDALSTVRLWAILKRFFRTTADLIEAENPALAVKLRLAGPHWMRHYVPSRIMSGSVIELRDRPRITGRKASVLKRSPDIISRA